MVYDSLVDRQIYQNGPTTPCRQRLPAITPTRFSLFRFRSPLLSESLLFSLPVGTEMFHFPTFPPNALCVQAPVTGLYSSWVSPFGHPRITARLPTPLGLSQAPTSFIGSWCQGIHLVLLVACRHKDARVHCVVLNIRAVPRGERRLPTFEGWRFDARHGPTKVLLLRARSFRTQQCARPLQPLGIEVRSEDLLTMSRVSRGANSRRSTSEHHRVETNARPTTTWTARWPPIAP